MSAEAIGGAVLDSFWWITAAALVLAACLRVGEGLAPGLRYLLALGAAGAAPVLFVAGLRTGDAVGVGYAAEEWARPAGVAWMWGVGLLSLRMLGGWVYLQMVIRGAVAQPWANLDGLRAKMGVRRVVELRASGRTDSPFTAGWRRPVIVVPLATLAGLPAEQLEAVLLHELAHIRRLDYVMEWVLQGLETVFFYHPAMWWMAAMAREERERSCDDMAIEAGAERAAYARALVEMEEMRVPAAAIGWRGGDLKARVGRILGVRQRTPVWPVVLLAALGLAGQGTTAWQKWVDEDVAYVIRPEEKKAYLALRDDAEREQFVKQFWARRDPTPGTEKNEFKEEHYRRLGWVMGKYGPEGWKTEKGKTYVQYGPPDEIESHPAKGYEQWMYHYLEGRGKNVIFTFGKR